MTALGRNLFLVSPGFWWLQAFLGLWPCLWLFLVTLVAQMVQNPPAMQEMQVWSLGREDPLEKEMTTHSSVFLPGKSHGQRSLWATVHGVAERWT